MFKVDVDSVEAYLRFDPARRGDLEALDLAIRAAGLPRYFHVGTPKGQPGMRFKMIGYGRTVSAGGLEWPRVGVAFQKAYISVYLLEAAALEPFRGRLGEVRMGQGNFSFVRFADLNGAALTALLDGLQKG